MQSAVWLLPAKSQSEDESRWLPLIVHLLDTAGVMQELIARWLPACLPGLLGFSREEFSALARFLSLTHDLGKATPAFAAKLLPRFPEIEAALRSMGLSLPSGMLNEKSSPHAHAGAALLRRAGVPDGVASIVGAHHGRPETQEQSYDDDMVDSPKCYVGDEGSRWQEVQKQLIDWARQEAGYRSLEKLGTPSQCAQMVLTGLLIMADWIASNTACFPLISVDCRPMEYDVSRLPRAMERLNLPGRWPIDEAWRKEGFFQKRFGFKANEIQRAAMETAASMSEPGCLILEAPMGVGKTEAALAVAEIWISRFQLGGVEFFLPSQATGNAMFSRLTSWLRSMPQLERISVELAHALAGMNEEFASLAQGQAIVGEEAQGPLEVHTFFQGRKTRLLASAVVGTVDQLLMAGLRQKHVMLRHLGLAGKVLIIDECHAYDAYMNCFLDKTLRWLGAYGVPVILLSATLPHARRQELLRAYFNEKRGPKAKQNLSDPSDDYPLMSWTEQKRIHQRTITSGAAERTVTVERLDEEYLEDTAAQALVAGACVGIIVNTVRRAQALAIRFRQRLPETVLLLDHSQLLAPDRTEREQEIIARVGKRSTPEHRRGVLIIGTQVLEQSLDLDFDLLITDLCPMDLLLQRAGRLHRHVRLRPKGFCTARLLVLNAKEALESGASAIYGDYLLLRTRALLPDQFSIPRDVSPLVQAVYDETRFSPEVSEEYELARQKFETQVEERKMRAGQYCISDPSRFPNEPITGLLDTLPGMNDSQAQAAVRDGASSIEVLVLSQAGDQAVLLSGEERGKRLSLLEKLCLEDARKVARQRLRLPQRFSASYLLDETIKCLEGQTAQIAAEWLDSPMLTGELFLFLNERGEGSLAGFTVHYDSQRGLECVSQVP